MKKGNGANHGSGISWAKRVFQLFLITVVCSFAFFTFNAISHHDGEALISGNTESVALAAKRGQLRKGAALSDVKPKSIPPKTIISSPSKEKRGGLSNFIADGDGNENFALKQKSKYAYVTLISGIDESFRYRGFLYNALIMKKALADAGSTADFIAMIGYKDDDNTAPFSDDMKLLTDSGILIYKLPRWVHEDHDLSFAEMALLKITPWSFTHYDKVQFFDGDVMPTKNMDCLFKLKYNTFTAGAVSPLNSGWYLGIPNKAAYEYMKEKAIWRLSKDWDKELGWNEKMPSGLVVRGGQPASKLWDFNGSDMDQGLLLHYHVINHGQSLLIDTQTGVTRLYVGPHGLSENPPKVVKTEAALECCHSIAPNPTSMFAHFTGRGKPWMLNDDNDKNKNEKEKRLKNKDVRKWFEILDSLNINEVNSKNIGSLHLGSPLGFWNHNFPKGGFNLQDKHAHLSADKE